MPKKRYFHELRNVRIKEINGFGVVAVSLHGWMPRIISDLNYYDWTLNWLLITPWQDVTIILIIKPILS